VGCNIVDFFWKGWIRRFSEPLSPAHWFLLPESEIPQLASQNAGCCDLDLNPSIDGMQPDR
jgi:hypothetical protein